MIQGVALIILGAIAASSFLYKYSFLQKYFSSWVVPIQGLLGSIFCIWGIYSLIANSYPGIEHFQGKAIYAIAELFVSVMHIILGYLLGYNLISISLVSDCNYGKINNYKSLSQQTPMNETGGILGIIIGLGSIVIYAFC